jgi:hypothetical protein
VIQIAIMLTSRGACARRDRLGRACGEKTLALQTPAPPDLNPSRALRIGKFESAGIVMHYK